MPLTNSSGTALTKAQLTALGTEQATDTVYRLGADVYEQYFLPGEDTSNGPQGWRRKFGSGELLTAAQITGLYPDPVINTVTPGSGSDAGGTTVVIAGSNLTWGASATFGGAYATSVVVNEYGTTLTCITPAGTAGAVDVVVNRGDGSTADTLADGYVYIE